MSKADDAMDIAAWYERQPHAMTTLHDSEIGVALGWVKRPAAGGDKSGEHGVQALGDVGRVRKARAYVDKDRVLFDGYTFGTRTNGAGRSVSRLNAPSDQIDRAGTNLHIATDVGRVLQVVQQHEAEIQMRLLPDLRSHEVKLLAAGDVVMAMAVHDAIRDIETHGRVSPATCWELTKVGIKLVAA